MPHVFGESRGSCAGERQEEICLQCCHRTYVHTVGLLLCAKQGKGLNFHDTLKLEKKENKILRAPIMYVPASCLTSSMIRKCSVYGLSPQIEHKL